MSTTISIEVIESNCEIDVNAIEELFRQKLGELVSVHGLKKEQRAKQEQQLAAVVHAVFDRFPGKRVLLGHLVSMALAPLNLDPETYGAWEKCCLDYIRSNAKGEDALFDIGRGTKNGGVARRGDLQKGPQSEATPMDAAAE